MTNHTQKFNDALKAEVAKGVTEITEQFVEELVERLGGGYEFDTYYTEFNPRSVDEVIIPEGITYIGTNAFTGFYGITSITIPNSLTTIGDFAFISLNIKNVVLGNGVKRIGKKAFFDCIRLTQINIPNSVTNIGEEAFFNCSRLEKITIPSATKIGENTFGWCGAKVKRLA